ncbi:hypothetical protein NHX12_027715 [Muraenolepis orangiensis]|uniref:Uncharacterized protein n=1 Tax=Muraenolepis orangiensis TaxID=630683 RepID=A0A9Q0EEA0_9TELE|nr:hypothetical protein NHX12_027715 [Muraenolepis orangiensis]
MIRDDTPRLAIIGCSRVPTPLLWRWSREEMGPSVDVCVDTWELSRSYFIQEIHRRHHKGAEELRRSKEVGPP